MSDSTCTSRNSCYGRHRRETWRRQQGYILQLAGIPLLPIDDAAQELAQSFVDRRIVPDKVVDDALHVAIAATQGMDCLLTWNCRHIANAEVIERLEAACLELGLLLPTLCTPEQLMGD